MSHDVAARIYARLGRRTAMTRILKTSGFLGLTATMLLGLHGAALVSGAETVPQWLTTTLATLGGLSVLAIVSGVVIEHRDVEGGGRAVITGLFLPGQWLVPTTIAVGDGLGVRGITPTLFLWVGLLAGAMAGMAYVSARRIRSPPAPPGPDPERPNTPGPDTPGPDTPGPDTPGPETPGPARTERTPPKSSAETVDRTEAKES
jgi:hypothetical protein